MEQSFKPAVEAAQRGDVEGFKAWLVENPGMVTKRSPFGHPNLFQFVVVDGGIGRIPDPLRFVHLMIEFGAPLDEPLVAAASVNQAEMVDTILAAGADIEACAPWTALEEALYWSHHDMAQHLIDAHGASIRSLRAAAELGRLDLMEAFFDEEGQLLPTAGDVVFPFGNVANTPGAVLNQALFLALRNDQYEAADLLFQRGANLNTIAMGHHEHCTPLHQAVYLNRPKMIEWLLERGARADIDDPRFNQTAIGWARHFEREEVARSIEAAV